MRFDVITLFPELISPLFSHGINRRAFESGQVEVRLTNPRDFAEGQYRRVDDRPFGGGPGMVMMAQPLQRCVAQVCSEREQQVDVILFSPIGQALDHDLVVKIASGPGAILICGRYEGLDQRFIDQNVTHQISLGDFVLSGGEIAAMAVLDAVARLQPGVLHDPESHEQDSFNPLQDGLLDCPHYTRPESWGGMTVPDVLMSGNHAWINRWRREQRLKTTAIYRPDLIERARLAGLLSSSDELVLEKSRTGL